MKILFVHQNFPGQYRQLAPSMVAAGHDVMAISTRKEARIGPVRNICYDMKRPSAHHLHPWLVNTESALIRGEAVAKVARGLREQGWEPDVVVGHTGWGETMFLQQALPNSRIVGFCEYWYKGEGADAGFDPEFKSANDVSERSHARNMHLAMSLLACDVGVSPTEWQASLFPDELRQRIQVIHDGVDTDKLVPDDQDWIELKRDNFIGRKGDEIVTFINRNLEPMRGYHQFMRALPAMMEGRPNAHFVIVGGDRVSYGAPPPGGTGYRNIFFNEVRDQLDMSRVHFVNQVPYRSLISLLRISSAHVYFTYPFVLSWSMIEAMSVGALVIGSNTPPVAEVIQSGQNGMLVDFFKPAELANAVCDALARPSEYEQMRCAARQTVIERYDYNRVCLPQLQSLITNV